MARVLTFAFVVVVGNTRFRDLVGSLLDEYSSATSKLEKSAIVQRVLIEVRTKSPNGGFIKKDPLTGQWYEVCTVTLSTSTLGELLLWS